MKNTAKTYFVVIQILDLLLGLTYCIAPIIIIIATITGRMFLLPLVPLLFFAVPFIVFAILLFKASSKFAKAGRFNDKELVEKRSNLLGWGIFSAIMLAPSVIGFIVLLVFVILTNNYILNLEKQLYNEEAKPFREYAKQGVTNLVEDTKEIFGVKSEMEKQKEALTELKKWKEEGLLTEEEYNAKRKQILKI